jgi:hypothetical protein
MKIFGFTIRRARPVVVEDVLRAGDRMQLNMDSVDKFFVDQFTGNVDVIVEKVVTHDDGNKELYLRNLPKHPFPA